MQGTLLSRIYIILWWFMNIHEGNCGYYITADYYMDPTQSDAFGGICDDHVKDDSMIINSHMNPFNLVSYGNNKNCWLLLDAGGNPGASYMLRFLRWEIENPYTNGTCRDHLTLYDGYDKKNKDTTTMYGQYCGTVTPNITAFPAGRYATLIWTTDRQFRQKGFRLLATRTEPRPCRPGMMLCNHDDRCISSSLYCDGTRHCRDGQDELTCTGTQKFVGAFLRLGLGGIVAVSVTVIGALIFLAILACCVKCFKKSNKVTEVVVKHSMANGGPGSDANKPTPTGRF